MLAQRLKTETRPQHDQVEKIAHSAKIMAGSLSLAEYRELLAAQYWLHLAIEPQMEAALGPELATALAWPQRQKLGWLRADLAACAPGVLTAPVPQVAQTFQLANVAQAWGALYVLEGSTLGGAVIRRHLAQNPQLAGQVTEFHFYGGYGPLTGERWKQFQTELENWSQAHPAQHDAVVEKAQATFALLEAIMAPHLVSA
ncbi:MAG: biliverdin-producing heme oxygenase [Bernardetiaceae bacterium]|jgi:heme oxygenase|nr:biliverdin-producing heme oxygenase [Bernardetiaceae bacterium]